MIIDVSQHQGVIEWKEVGKVIDYAILRCGYGSNIHSQHDKQFNYNATQCEKYGIPYGVYLYSYAKNLNNNLSEINHILSQIKNRNVVMPLYYDIEETDICYKYDVKKFAENFVRTVRANGYEAGIYSGEYIFKKYLNTVDCDSRWVARYNRDKPRIKYDIWQYTSTGVLSGINKYVDLNIYKDSDLFSDFYYDNLVNAVLEGMYGNGADRKKKVYSMGVNYWKVQNMINILMKM